MPTKRDPPDPPGTQALDGTEPIPLGRGPTVPLTIRSAVWTIHEGPDAGSRFTTEQDPVTIGGAPDNAIVLRDPAVSRHHAEIHAVREGFRLKDLDSRNGTFVEGKRIVEMFLDPGTRVRFGRTTMSFDVRLQEHQVAPDMLDSFHGLRGQSLKMRQLFGVLRKVAATDVTVVIHGETGTGKELVARAIHLASRRAKSPLVVVDCSAMERDLAGSELFGHEAGAFTGARDARAGAFEEARGGTVFIDELGELAPEHQVKLLRVLEQREIKRLGSNKTLRVDCRVVAATHRDLIQMVNEGRFREDLYFRFAQIVVAIPPLRERREDIPFLAGRFLEEARESGAPATRFSPEALETLGAAELRGNVRELKNFVQRAAVMCSGHTIEVSDLGLDVAFSATAAPALRPAEGNARAPIVRAGGALQDADRSAIVEALERHGYHRARTAAALGITVPTLRARIRRYGIELPGRGEADEEG